MQNCMKLMEISGIHLTLQEEASEMDIEEGGTFKARPSTNLFRDHVDPIFCIGRVGGYK